MTLAELKIKLLACLNKLYNPREAKAIAKRYYLEKLQLSPQLFIVNPDAKLSEGQEAYVLTDIIRFQTNEPLQHILGYEYFCDHKFFVNHHTLIPRPETEMLVQLADPHLRSGIKVLDIGTGSGCLAISIALLNPEANVNAIDISEEALAIAIENQKTLGADNVQFSYEDIIYPSTNFLKLSWNIIVSNPPYIPISEMGKMDKNVVGFEPHSALFVPDADPLLFYKAILNYALQTLILEKGIVLLECHTDIVNSVGELFAKEFKSVQIYNDLNNRPRFVSATNISLGKL